MGASKATAWVEARCRNGPGAVRPVRGLDLAGRALGSRTRRRRSQPLLRAGTSLVQSRDGRAAAGAAAAVDLLRRAALGPLLACAVADGGTSSPCPRASATAGAAAERPTLKARATSAVGERLPRSTACGHCRRRSRAWRTAVHDDGGLRSERLGQRSAMSLSAYRRRSNGAPGEVPLGRVRQFAPRSPAPSRDRDTVTVPTAEERRSR